MQRQKRIDFSDNSRYASAMTLFLENDFMLVTITVLIVIVFFVLLIAGYLFHRLRRSNKKLTLEAENIQVLENLLNEASIEGAVVGSQVDHLKVENQSLRKNVHELTKYKEEYIRVRTSFDALTEKHEAQISLAEDFRSQLLKDMESSASRLFDLKKQRFESTNADSMTQLLDPLNQRISEFNLKLEESFKSENQHRGQLIGQIMELQKQTVNISSEANSLSNALRNDNKVQGRWGEVVLESLLNSTGLREGFEYFTQKVFRGREGQIVKPDVVVSLPKNKTVVIDSKVSLKSYEKLINLGASDEYELQLRNHIASVRSHVKVLAKKQYEKIEFLDSVNFVFIFIPIDHALSLALNNDDTLFDFAYEKNIVLVSPSSLMVSLKTIEMLWQHSHQNRNAKLIADSAGKIYDQFSLFLDGFEDTGKLLSRAQQQFEVSKNRLVSGRGSLAKKISALKELGANTSRTIDPNTMLGTDEDDLNIDDLKVADEQSKNTRT